MGERRRRVDHVLAVVQDQQYLAVTDRRYDSVERLRLRCTAEQRVAQSERGRAPIWATSPSDADRRQLHQPRAVRQVVEQSPRGLHRKAGLARATGAGQGGEPMFGDEFADDRDITELADELGQFGAQVRPAVRPRARPTSPRSSATCSADNSGEGSTPRVSASASRARWYTVSASVPRPAAASARISATTSRSRTGCAGDQFGQLGDQLRATTEADLGFVAILDRGQAQPLEPGDQPRRTPRCRAGRRPA